MLICYVIPIKGDTADSVSNNEDLNSLQTEEEDVPDADTEQVEDIAEDGEAPPEDVEDIPEDPEPAPEEPEADPEAPEDPPEEDMAEDEVADDMD